MDSLLESVLAATEANQTRGPVIVSENNDLGAINVEESAIQDALRGISGARGWDAAEYGITAQQAAEMIRAADTPENRARVMGELRQRAINRANLDTTGGKVAVVVAGQPAWHRLGVNVAEALTAADAIRLAGMQWSVSKRPMLFKLADGTYRESDDTFAIVRDDSQDQLGTVGGRYEVIQNADGFAFLDSVIGEFGAKYHTAGAIKGGRSVWVQCELPEHGFEVVKGDEVQAFATFTNPHDGTGKAWCFPTTNRIVCANTFRTASKEREKGLGIRHTGNIKGKVTEARRVLGLAVEEIDQFKAAADVMVRTPCDAEPFFENLFDAVLDITAAEAEKGADALAACLRVTEIERELARKRYEREIARREHLLEDILQRYESERCGVGGIRGSQWAAFNAVTEHADYVNGKRKVGTEADRLSRKFESVLIGEADEIKQTAFEMLTAARAN